MRGCAERQTGGRPLRMWPEIQVVERLVRHLSALAIAERMHTRALQRDVLGHGHGREQHDVLERPRDTRPDDAVGASAQQVATFEQHTTRIGLRSTGDDVEERRLAGAVWADETADRALLQGERHIVERNDPAETPRHVLDSEECHGATTIKRSGVELNTDMVELEGESGARRLLPPLQYRPRPPLPPAVFRRRPDRGRHGPRIARRRDALGAALALLATPGGANRDHAFPSRSRGAAADLAELTGAPVFQGADDYDQCLLTWGELRVPERDARLPTDSRDAGRTSESFQEEGRAFVRFVRLCTTSSA